MRLASDTDCNRTVMHVSPWALTSSGVTLANASAYLQAGAVAVGFVNSLFVPEDIKAGAFERIELRAKEMLLAVKNA